jgi:cytochrome c-type biogenesis protein CcmH/NrfG
MPTAVWQVIAIAVVVISLVGYFAIGRWQTVEATDDLREAERELDARQEASPLPTARRREWTTAEMNQSDAESR